MKQAVVLVAIAGVLAGASTRAQPQSLSDADAAAAIAAGAREKDRRHGLVLPSPGGFSLEAFTPTSWIRQLAADFAREDHVMTVNNLPLDGKAPVLRLAVEPDVPAPPAAGNDQASSVQRVELRNRAGTIVIAPLSEEPFHRRRRSATGGAVTVTGLLATFSLDALEALRGPQHLEPVFVTVVGSKGRVDVEMTSDHFARLP